MNLATLRASGAEESLESLCNLLALEVDTAWKKGDPKRGGGYHFTSGLNATIADVQTPGEIVLAIREFVAKCKTHDLVFSEADLSVEIAIGISVGDEAQFFAHIGFPAADLLAMGAIGIELSVAAYPTSEEANEVQPAA